MSQSDLHVILHVPKCAGSTIERHLIRNLGVGPFWSPPKRSTRFPLQIYGRKYNSKPPGPLQNVMALSGHYLGESIESLFPSRRMVRSLILRNPESLMVSYYNYRMMRYVTQKQKTYSFRTHMMSMTTDPVTHFLLERWLELPWIRVAALNANQKLALLDQALSKFDRIVDISDADELAVWHSSGLGISTDVKRLNTSEDWEERSGWMPVKLSDLSAVEREILVSRLVLDRYIWRKWAQRDNVAYPHSHASFLRSEFTRIGHQIRRRHQRDYSTPIRRKWEQ